jgi:protein TonB
MKNYFFLLFVFFLFQSISAQEIVSVPPDKIYYLNEVDVKPEFPKGINAFHMFIGKNFKTPRKAGLNGKVVVSYIIETDGTLSNINIIQDIGYGTAEEALRVFGKSPKWIPGQFQGGLVRVINFLPITINTPD